METGLARRDEELLATLRISSKAIGAESLCNGVEAGFQKELKRAGDRHGAAMPRAEAILKFAPRLGLKDGSTVTHALKRMTGRSLPSQ